MLDAHFLHIYFCQSLPPLQRGSSVIADLLVFIDNKLVVCYRPVLTVAIVLLKARCRTSLCPSCLLFFVLITVSTVIGHRGSVMHRCWVVDDSIHFFPPSCQVAILCSLVFKVGEQSIPNLGRTWTNHSTPNLFFIVQICCFVSKAECLKVDRLKIKAKSWTLPPSPIKNWTKDVLSACLKGLSEYFKFRFRVRTKPLIYFWWSTHLASCVWVSK